MNDAIDIAAMTLGAIGQPVRRKEDKRLLTGKGRFTDDFSIARQAYAVMVRSPHAPCADPSGRRNTSKADAGCPRRAWWQRLPRRRACANSAQSGALDPIRSEADRAGRRRDLYRPADPVAGRQGPECRRSGRDGGG